MFVVVNYTQHPANGSSSRWSRRCLVLTKVIEDSFLACVQVETSLETSLRWVKRICCGKLPARDVEHVS